MTSRHLTILPECRERERGQATRGRPPTMPTSRRRRTTRRRADADDDDADDDEAPAGEQADLRRGPTTAHGSTSNRRTWCALRLECLPRQQAMSNPKRAPVIMPKGQRYPGSGRAKGTPNRVSVEARVLVGQLVQDGEYQARLRRDFALRKLHPTIEAMVWAYHVGKPRETVTVNATVDINARIEEERRVFAALEIHDLEQLAAESQALVDRAVALAKVRSGGAAPQDVVVPADLPKVSEETLGIMAGSDNGSSDNQTDQPDDTAVNSDRTEG